MSSGTVILGRGTAITTINATGGSIINQSQTGTITAATLARQATMTHEGSTPFTTLNVDKRSSVFYAGSGTITTLNLTGTLDLSTGSGAVTITNANLYDGATIRDPLGRLTFTNPPRCVRCSVDDLTLDFGQNRTIQIGS